MVPIGNILMPLWSCKATINSSVKKKAVSLFFLKLHNAPPSSQKIPPRAVWSGPSTVGLSFRACHGTRRAMVGVLNTFDAILRTRFRMVWNYIKTNTFQGHFRIVVPKALIFLAMNPRGSPSASWLPMLNFTLSVAIKLTNQRRKRPPPPMRDAGIETREGSQNQRHLACRVKGLGP